MFTQVTQAALFAIFLLAAGDIGAQFAERAVGGGTGCWRVMDSSGQIVSYHKRQTTAQIAAVNYAKAPGGGPHGYANGCFYDVSGEGIPSWPQAEPGQVLLTMNGVLTRGQATGQLWDYADLQWSPNGTDWYPSMRLTFNPAQLLDLIPLNVIQLRLVVPETQVEGAIN